MSDKQVSGLPEGITEDLAKETIVSMQNFIKATRGLVAMMDKLEKAAPSLADQHDKQEELLGMVRDLEEEINALASVPGVAPLLKDFVHGS